MGFPLPQVIGEGTMTSIWESIPTNTIFDVGINIEKLG